MEREKMWPASTCKMNKRAGLLMRSEFCIILQANLLVALQFMLGPVCMCAFYVTHNMLHLTQTHRGRANAGIDYILLLRWLFSGITCIEPESSQLSIPSPFFGRNPVFLSLLLFGFSDSPHTRTTTRGGREVFF